MSNKPIENLDGLKGMKVRSTPSKLELAYLSRLGVSPVPMSWGEIFTALQQNTIDGINIDIPYGLWGNIFEVAKNTINVPLSYYPHLFIFSKAVWKKMNDMQKQAVLKAWEISNSWDRIMTQRYEEEFQTELEKRGVKFYDFTPEEQKKMEEMTAGLEKEFADQIEPELVEEFKKTIVEDRAIRRWW